MIANITKSSPKELLVNQPDQEGISRQSDDKSILQSKIDKMLHFMNEASGPNAQASFLSVSPLKVWKSKNKRRLIIDGMNLDLTYVTEKIIAMCFPGESLRSFYRNDMEDVKRFFRNRHSEKYRVYNLCSEEGFQYDNAHFNNNVTNEFGFLDRQVPSMKFIFNFCQDVNNWLQKDEQNVIAIHCNAGRARTGIMTCSYLMFSGVCKNAKEALKYYGHLRTVNGKGVTIPSQKRYIGYFEKAMELGWTANTVPKVTIAVKKIKLCTVPTFGSWFNKGCSPSFIIENHPEEGTATDYDSKDQFPINNYTSTDEIVEFNDIKYVICAGDVLVDLYHSTLFGKEKMCQVWFNTAFLPTEGKIVFEKSEIDEAQKDKDNTLFDKNFKIEVHYEILRG